LLASRINAKQFISIKILAQRNKAILTWFLREMLVYFASSQNQNKKFAYKYVHAQFNIFLALPPSVPPRNYDILMDRQTRIEISTIHRSARKTGSSELWRNLHVNIRIYIYIWHIYDIYMEAWFLSIPHSYSAQVLS
jgi:hypothetical protein